MTSGQGGTRYDALLREAAHRLADTVAPYRVLTRGDLAELSGTSRWHTIRFDDALRWAVEHDFLRMLEADLYEIAPGAGQDGSPRSRSSSAGTPTRTYARGQPRGQL